MGSCLGSCCDDGVPYHYEESTPFLGYRVSSRFQSVRHVEGAPTDKKWYHASITNQEAERRLGIGSRGNDNSYIVYDNPRKAGQYILLVINKEKLYRWKIIKRQSDGKFIIGEDIPGAKGFDSVRELIKAHRGIRGKPIKTDAGMTLTLSRTYVYVDS